MPPPPPPPPPPPASPSLATRSGAPAPPPPPPPPSAPLGGSTLPQAPPPPQYESTGPVKSVIQGTEPVSVEETEITEASIPDVVEVDDSAALSSAMSFSDTKQEPEPEPEPEPELEPEPEQQNQQENDINEVQQTNKGPEGGDTVDATERPKGNVPVVHGTYEKNEDEEEVMVKTEFVWADGAENDVKLSGAWNGWMTIQMYHEGGGMWSVVTPVPTGVHEFKFVVDGEWRHSTRHPTVGDKDDALNNVRMIRGPPRTGKKEEKKSEVGDASQKKSCCVIS